MKYIISFILAFTLISSASLVDASEYYKVEPSKGIKAGVYKDGKLIIAAVNRKVHPGEDQDVILDVKKVKNTIFFTEYKTFNGSPMYILKMKNGKDKVKILKDVIVNYMPKIATDGKYLYYVSTTKLRYGDLIRLSSDGKQRTVLEKDVEDFWYANNQLFYVKKHLGYSVTPPSAKKTQISLGNRKLYPPSYSKVEDRTYNNYRISNNGIMYIVRKTKKDNYVFDFYSFKTKKITQHVIKSYSTLYNKEMSNILSEIRDLDPSTSEFIESGTSGLELFSPGGRTIKTILTHKETGDTNFPYLVRFLRVDIVKREIVFVKGTRLVTKKF